MVLKDEFVYAIGGRTYGEDSVAIRKECERYDLIKKEWIRLPDMKT